MPLKAMAELLKSDINVSCSLCPASRYSTASGKSISISVSISKFNSEVSGSVFFSILLFCWQCLVSCGVLH